MLMTMSQASDRPVMRAIAFALLLVGCSTQQVFAPSELPKLEGLRDQTSPIRHLRDTRGQNVAVTSDTRLTFHLMNGTEREYRFSSIQVIGQLFSGTTS